MSFKFERLPNFCYRCGLLNHVLKDCTEGNVHNKDDGENVFQYGAWMRGDLIRRNGVELFRSGVRAEAEGSAEKSEVRMGKSSMMSQIPRKDTGAGKNPEVEKTITKESVPMQGGDGTSPHTPLSENLYEKGNLHKCVGKLGGKEVSLGSQEKV